MALVLPTRHLPHHANTSLQPSLKRGEILIPKISPQDAQGTISRLLPFPLHSGLGHRPQPKDPVHVPQHCNGAGLCGPGALLPCCTAQANAFPRPHLPQERQGRERATDVSIKRSWSFCPPYAQPSITFPAPSPSSLESTSSGSLEIRDGVFVPQLTSLCWHSRPLRCPASEH